MITFKDNICQINTLNTSYLFTITKYGDAMQLYYGAKIPNGEGNVLIQKRSLLLVNSLYMDKDVSYGIDDMQFEYSYAHRGDSRPCAMTLRNENGEVFDMVFDCYKIGENPPTKLTKSHGHSDSIKLVFKCLNSDIIVEHWYLVYEDSDVISRFVRVINNSNCELDIFKVMSMQLDMEYNGQKLITFNGAWGRERYKNCHEIAQCRIVCGSNTGMSSAECNPFFIVGEQTSSNTKGDCFAFNLVYSGSHEISVGRDSFDNLRIMNGINSDGFCYKLAKGCEFVSPESVITFGKDGYNSVSQNMHKFIENNIVRYKGTIPIMLNTWEAVYFDISYEKVSQIADKAKEMGFEALVIDDGWFGVRNDDTSSLGDWFENTAKFPNGLEQISKYIQNKDLKFGIWLEPEMISENSDLYRKNSHWAIKIDGIREIVGRNQMILDLTNVDVREYLINSISQIIEKYNVDYIKWDYNRRFSDIAGGRKSGQYLHEYIMSLYEILETLTTKYPNVIIEGCASGGGRFDLGMLCYSPIIWTSDNTNPHSRAHIQDGTSYGYPISVMINHISPSPSHQTARATLPQTVIDIASVGRMGSQLDITKCSEQECDIYSNAIKNYKNIRNIIHGCSFSRLSDGFVQNDFVWQAMDEQCNNGFITIFHKRFNTVSKSLKIKLTGLNADINYNVYDRNRNFEITAKGATLMNVGLVLPQNYQGNEKNSNSLMLIDDTALTLTIQAISK